MIKKASELLFSLSMPGILINLLHSKSLGSFITYLNLLRLALMKRTVHNRLLIAKACKRREISWPMNLNDV